MEGALSGAQFSYRAYERRYTQTAGRTRDTYTVLFPDPTRSDYLPHNQVSFPIATE